MRTPNPVAAKGYEPFDHFIFRMPFFHSAMQDDYENLLQNAAFNEALYLASKPLYAKALLHKNDDFPLLPDKVKRSLFKYFTRMTTRTTPFGLFAGCGTGSIGTEAAVRISDNRCFQSRTTVNTHFLQYLSGVINDSCPFGSAVLYYPNTTLFRVYNLYRYIEVKPAGNDFNYLMSEVGVSSYLDGILQAAAGGTTRAALAEILMKEEEVEYEEAREFIEELILNQVLVSEFGIYITKEDNLGWFIERLSSLDGCTDRELLPFLQKIRQQLQQIDEAPVGEKLHHLKELSILIQLKFGQKEEEDYLRLNLLVQPTQATLSKDITEMVKRGLHVLNLMAAPYKAEVMNNFKEKFYQRYEHEEVPLAEALDPDIGVSRGNFSPASIGIHPLIGGIFGQPEKVTPGGPYAGRMINLNSFIQDKYFECLRQQEYVIHINEKDLRPYSANWDDLPFTLSVGVEILKAGQDQAPMVLMKYAGGLSAVNTLSRFGNLNERFQGHLQEIADFEESCCPEGTVIADIVYKVEDQGIANIMQRPSLRKYEIPILSLPSGNAIPIPLSDIMISLTEDRRLVLRSAKLNKRIIPRNSTAHNFIYKTTPLYKFLSYYQSEDYIRGGMYFNWGELEPHNGCYPRVVYEQNIVLAAARWMIREDEIHPGKDFSIQLQALRKQRNIPRKVYLIAGMENKLMLDLDRDATLEFLRAELKQGPLLLEECLLDEKDAFITTNGLPYNHEVIINFYKM
jgi:hypothetical protein